MCGCPGDPPVADGAVSACQGGRMELRDAIRRRRMVRAYDPDRPVPTDVVDRLLEHAVRSPSAGFSQGWDFLVLETAEERDLFWRSTTEPGTDPGSVAPWPDERTVAGGVPQPQGRLPRPVRRAGQGLDRPRRGALARAVLGRRHRDGGAADAAHGRRRGARVVLLRGAARAPRLLPDVVRRPGRPLPRGRGERRVRGRRPQEPEPAARPARARAGGARRPVRRALPPRPVEHRGRGPPARCSASR